MPKSKKNKNKAKLNLTVRDEQRNKLEQMASLENRSVSNLIEVMADERWKRLAEQQGIAYAQTKHAVTASILFCRCAICQPKSDLAIYPRLSRRPELTLCKDAEERAT